MVSWSNILRSSESKFQYISKLICRNDTINGQIRKSHHQTFEIKPSTWQWQKTKDYFHFYVMIGAIPLATLTFLVNVFIGPATLEPIPEGYEPKHWEYHRHPITRFIARYMMPPPQQEYEKTMYAMWRECRNADVRKLERRVEDLIRERDDYQHYYFIPQSAKYHYQAKERKAISTYGVPITDYSEKSD